jgi:hypothetical protein
MNPREYTLDAQASGFERKFPVHSLALGACSCTINGDVQQRSVHRRIPRRDLGGYVSVMFVLRDQLLQIRCHLGQFMR